jgi:hypothetical protein
LRIADAGSIAFLREMMPQLRRLRLEDGHP